jgi:D-alanine-D-alanine ligase
MSAPRVLVLHNEPVLPVGHPDYASEYEIVGTADSVARTLTDAGFEVRRLGVGTDPAVLVHELRRERPDAVFNLFEGLATHTGTEATVVGLLEWLGVPCTGSPAAALTLALDKLQTKRLLRGAGLPTPAFVAVEWLPAPDWPHGWPAIVKPARQDASVGIEQASVVTSTAQLGARCAWVLERFGAPALVEQFVPGREFHVHILEESTASSGGRSLLLLPLAEIVFLQQGEGYWPIYSYDAKWAPGSREYEVTPLRSPVTLEPGQMDRLAEIARAAFDLLGCRDYARLDVRMTPEGDFFILEINPNPFLNSKAVTSGLEAVGRTQREFFLSLVRAALARGAGAVASRPTGKLD